MLNQRSFYGSSWRLEHVISSMEHEYDTSIRGERKLLHTIIPLIQLTWKPSNRVQPKSYFLGWLGTWLSHKDHDLVYMTALGWTEYNFVRMSSLYVGWMRTNHTNHSWHHLSTSLAVMVWKWWTNINFST